MNYKIRILAVNIFDILNQANITITPSPISTLPLSNLQLEEKSKITRVNSSNVEIKLLFDTNSTVNCVYLHDTNIYNGYALCKFYSDSWTTEIYSSYMFVSSSVITDWKPGFALLNCDPKLVKSVKITIYSTNSYFDCGRLFIGNALNPYINFSYGWSLGLVDQSTQERTESGVLHTQAKPSFRKVQFSLQELEKPEVNKWFNDLLYCGVKKQVLACLFPLGDNEELLNYTILGKFTEGEFSFTQDNFQSFSSSYTIEEGYTGNIGSNASIIFLNDQVINSTATISTQQLTIDTLTSENENLQERLDQLSKENLNFEARITSLEECCSKAESSLTELKEKTTTIGKNITYILSTNK